MSHEELSNAVVINLRPGTFARGAQKERGNFDFVWCQKYFMAEWPQSASSCIDCNASIPILI